MGRTSYYILFVDLAEWYVLCSKCYQEERERMWAGSTNLTAWSYKERQVYLEAIYEYANKLDRCERCGRLINVARRQQEELYT